MLIAHVIDAVLQLKDQFSGQLKNISKGLSDFQKQGKYVARDMKKVGKATENVGKNLITHVTVPLAGVGVAALKASNDFQDGMAKVSTIADTTKVSMDTLSKGVIDLSKETGININELAEAEYQALSASVDTGKVTEFLGIAAKSAKGGFTDTATAVEGLTNVLNAYGYEADKADQIANQMLITQNLGKTTFGELSSSMGKVTPVAANLGIKTEELFSSLAVTTAQGLGTAESVTALKAAMSNIIKPSKEASDAAEQLGIDFSVSALQSKGWIGFLKDVKKGLANASPEFKKISSRSVEVANKLAIMEKTGKTGSKEYKALKKESKNLSKEFDRLAKMSDSPISAMAQMFGSVEGLNSILMLTSDQGLSKYNESMKQMGTNTEAVQDAYDKMQTPAEKFRQSLNRAKISLLGAGGALTPAMESLGSAIDKITDKVSKLTPEQQKMIVKFGLIAAGVGPIVFAIGKTTVGISNTIKGINNLQKGIKKAGGVMKYFTSPGHKAVLIMTALAMVALLVYKNWGKLSKVFNKVGKSISKFTGISKKNIQKFGSFIGNFLKIIGGRLKKAIGSLSKTVLPPLKKLFATLKKLFQSLMPILMPILKFIGGVFVVGICAAFSIISTVVSTVIKTIGTIIGGLITILDGVINFIVGIFTGNWKQAWEGVKNIFKGILDILQGLWHGLVDLLTAPVQAIVDLLDSKFHDKVQGVKKAWNGIKTFLKHPIKGTVSLVKNGDLSGVKGKNALGTSYWGGGLSVVGEHGPEVVELPQGAAVHDNKDSRRMAGKSGNIAVNFTGDIHVRKESDIDAIANAIVKKLQIQQLNMA